MSNMAWYTNINQNSLLTCINTRGQLSLGSFSPEKPKYLFSVSTGDWSWYMCSNALNLNDAFGKEQFLNIISQGLGLLYIIMLYVGA